MDKLLFARWLRRFGFPVGLVTLLIICAMTTTILWRYAQLNAWTSHTHQVIATIAEIENKMERTETSARGYLLTKDSLFLEPYEHALKSLPSSVDGLAGMVGDNAAQLDRVAKFRALLDGHIERLAAAVAKAKLARAGSREHASGVERLAEMRALLMDMHAEEQGLLDQRRRAARDFANLAGWLMLIGAVVAVALVTFSYVSMKRALRANEGQAGLLRSIFDSIGDGLIVVDKEGVFTHYNRIASRVLNVKLDELKTIKDLADFHGVTAEQSPTRRALAGESVSDFEIALTRDGVPGFISIDSRPVTDADGERRGALAVVRDVTERRNLENEWKLARESALEASRLKSDFLATMSHEIRTPMNGVIGMATLLLATKLDQDQLSFVRTIKSSADSLLALINQVLDHARIESGKLQLVEVDFNLVDLIEGVLDLFRYLARSKSVELRLKISPDTPTNLHGDGDRLRQVIINLVGNAIKFTERGHVEINVEPKGDAHLEVSVRDTGRGIGPAAQASLFQKFSQVHEPGTQKGGSGLGLMISRELVRAMGGEISVDSAEGSGSRFYFTVRMAPAFTNVRRQSQDGLAATAANGDLKGRVLVAEDQPVNQLVIRKFLEKFKVSCVVVADGGAAVAALRAEPFDLVLMDCQMRPVDGYQATLDIREFERRHGLPPIPIIALTAEGMSGDRRRCFEVGMNAFLSKPIAIDHLHAMLKTYLTEVDVSDQYAPEALEKLVGFESDGRPLAAVLFDEFKTGGSADVLKLVAAGREKRWPEVKYLAHSLKSSGRTLGLKRFGEVCEALERTAGPSTEAASLIQELEVLYPAACQWLARSLPAESLG